MTPVPIIFGKRAVFIKHNGFSRTMTSDEIFAECVAEGDTLAEAARRAGLQSYRGSFHAKRIFGPTW